MGAILIEGRLSYLEQKVSNTLLGNAYPMLLKKDRFWMSWSALKAKIWYNSNDHDPLKKAILKLGQTSMICIDDDKVFQNFNHLNAPRIIWGEDWFEYGYDHGLPQLLHEPEIFALIDESTQAKFESKGVLLLYELILPFKKNAKYHGLTSVWTPEFLRLRLGLSDFYKSFRELRRKALEKYIAVINKESEIFIEMLEPQRQGRKVVGIQFQVSDNPNNVQAKLPWIQSQTDLLEAMETAIVKEYVSV